MQWRHHRESARRAADQCEDSVRGVELREAVRRDSTPTAMSKLAKSFDDERGDNIENIDGDSIVISYQIGVAIEIGVGNMHDGTTAIKITATCRTVVNTTTT